jgi:hypothetical protein
MPGDVARWPLGAAAGTLILADVAPTTTAIVGTLRDPLPQLGADDGDQGNFQAFAVVVRGTAAAIEDRTACATGKNFLQVAACDVVAASTVSGTVIGQLPRRLAVQLLPTVLDPDHWADWVGPRRTALTAVRLSERTLAQAAIPAPVVAPPPLPEPSTAPAPGPAAPAVPAAPVALPVPVPVPASSPPQLPNPGTGGSRLGGWLEDALGRIGSQEDGNGGGHGGGRGQGNGRGRGGR